MTRSHCSALHNRPDSRSKGESTVIRTDYKKGLEQLDLDQGILVFTYISINFRFSDPQPVSSKVSNLFDILLMSVGEKVSI